LGSSSTRRASYPITLGDASLLLGQFPVNQVLLEGHSQGHKINKDILIIILDFELNINLLLNMEHKQLEIEDIYSIVKWK
jgi:hypothetical protein